MAISKRPRHEVYTVGWICALHEELTAAKAMLDERHAPLSQPEHDHNSYILGSISGHKVVIACLPAGEYGTNAAAAVATQMRSTFSEIQFLLMVGIGGGVPETADIRLGDVVVSTPTGDYGGVVQYDLGKTVAEGRLVHTGMLNRPPQRLLTAVGNLRSERAMGFDRMSVFLRDMCKTYPDMSNFQYPKSAPDNLYRADYEHRGGNGSCDGLCDRHMVVSRAKRSSTKPQIHYGLIASGNQVIKDALSRSRLAKQYNILCFEMEAAGLMNQVPCLVIRGICDYADSHKNKKWQCYAAATAAAYTKELMGMLQIPEPLENDFKGQDEMSESFDSYDDASLAAQWQLDSELTPYRPQKSSRTAFFECLSTYDPYRTCQDYLRRRCPNTTKWILKHAALKDWRDKKTYPCLWLSGKIGSGKSLATSTVVHFLETAHPDPDVFVAHFFFSHAKRASLNAKSLFESFTKQILDHLTRTSKSYPRDMIKRIKSLYKAGGYPATLGEVVDEIFLLSSREVPDAIYVIDGLDECARSEILDVFGVIRKMISQNNSRVFVSARDGIDLIQAIPQAVTVSIADQESTDDIEKFIDWRIAEKSRDRPLTEDRELLQDIKANLYEKADHMILWVELQLNMLWEECYTDGEIRTALENLPKTLSETYDRCIARINKKQSDVARRVLYWICVAVEPFNASQLQEALALDLETGTADLERLLSPKEIVKLCSHLVIWHTNDNVRLAHASVDQFLQERSAGINQLWPEYTLAEAGLELAELCLARLLPLCSGGMLERYKSPADMTDSGSILSAIKGHIPYAELLGLSISRAPQIPWPPRPPQPKAMIEASAFFHFAKSHWAPLTEGIDNTSSLWRKFRRVALVQKPALSIHPWETIGESVDSQFLARLAWAITHKHRPLFSLLLGADRPQLNPDIFNIPIYHYDKLPLLHLAARSNFPDAVLAMLKLSKDSLLDAQKRLALHHAAETGSADAMRLLLRYSSALINVRDASGYAPLHLAAMNNRHEIIRLLVECGALITTMDGGGQTPLMYAAKHCEPEIIRLLIPNDTTVVDKDAVVNTAGSTRISPLHIAAERLDPRIISALCDKGADLEARDRERRTPLDVAAESFVKTNLLPFHTTPISYILFQAIKLGNVPVVQCLLHLGAIPMYHAHMSPTPASPLEMSLCQGHFEIAELLDGPGAWKVHTETWRDRSEIVIHEAFMIAQTLSYPLLFRACQGRDTPQVLLSMYRGGRPSAIPSVMATLACVFGHVRVVDAIVKQGYHLDVDYIFWTFQFLLDSCHLQGQKSVKADMSSIPQLRPLHLLRAVAKYFHRSEVELAILNITFRAWLEADRKFGPEKGIKPRAQSWI